MSQLMLVNPRRRKRRKMSAAQRKYFGKRRTSVSGKRNPRRRRRSAARTVTTVARRTARRARRAGRRFASNRSGSAKLLPANFIKGTVIPAGMGGAGALAVDVAWGFLPLPANIKTGPLAPVVKIGAALALGMVVSKVAGKAMGEKVTAGYLTVMAYNLLKGVVGKALPQLPLGDYNMGYVQAGPFLPDASMGVYLANDPEPAPVAADMGAYINGYEGDGYYG